MAFPSLTLAYDVLILQSRSDPAYDEVMRGFHFEKKTSLRMLMLSDYATVDVTRIVREERPRVILAVGDAALNATRKVLQTPVVGVMALGLHGRKALQANVTGIEVFAPPEQYINIFKAMKTRRVGIIHNPAKSGWYLQSARKAAAVAGIELVIRDVSAPRETIEQLSALAGAIDALWMLPDSTAVSRETTEAYFRFGQVQSIPVVSFAANYLGLGAAAIIEIDPTSLGRQADEVTADLLDGESVAGMPLRSPKGTKVKTNPAVLKRLGLSL